MPRKAAKELKPGDGAKAPAVKHGRALVAAAREVVNELGRSELKFELLNWRLDNVRMSAKVVQADIDTLNPEESES